MQEKINKKIRQKNEKENWERERERERERYPFLYGKNMQRMGESGKFIVRVCE